MKYISLTNGKKAIIDDEDFCLVSKYKWCIHSSISLYAVTSIPILTKKKGQAILFMHRLIMKAKKGELIDHINHNGLDNRKENLRIVSYRENSRNRLKGSKETSSKFKGVHFHTKRYKDKCYFYWRCQIKVNYKQIFLGNYKNEIDAAISYNNAAKKYFGEFACLNVI